MRLKTMEEIDESKEKKHIRKTHKESRRKGLLILHVRCDARRALPVVCGRAKYEVSQAVKEKVHRIG